ncbi:hypothetical protein N7449_005077 [Penicillium cf. viridicatum]|uniref:Uncharacterized protein n=1 Tax=Penicillium cf. viridicatum TaxID=2972119 RepID=A0A9W9SYP0_9EURO|nr:hypothetical protein N7449_005077 [Penicillium cf. viridicatum]
MPPTKLGSAFPPLQELAKWVYESAKMQQDKSICVDKNQVQKTLPLLKALGYDKIQGYGFAIHRISGNTEIVKEDGIRTLFFPLSVGSGSESIASGNVEVAGVMLTPGTFMEIDSTTGLNAHLDCLIVYLPEGR